MNRRALLKGTAVTGSGLLLANRTGVNISLAQAPSYTAEVINEFTEYKEGKYKVQNDGGFQAVSPDGVIAGWDWVDGKIAPVTWDLSGTRTPLDTGDIQYARSWALAAGANGYLAGNLAETDAADSPSIGVMWANGMPSRLDAGGGTSVNAKAVNANGVVGGAIDGIPSRWVDGRLEQFPIPDGAAGAIVQVLAENGDGYGSSYDSEGYALSLFRWKTDGTIQPIELPAEVTANSLEKIYTPIFAGVFENGDLVLSLSWVDAAGFATGSWNYEQGTPQPIASSAEDTEANVKIALSAGDIYGSMNQAVGGDTIGFIGAARWIDGVPYSLIDAATLPADVTFLSVRGVTADGVVVASTFATLSGLYSGVASLRVAYRIRP